MSGAVGIDLGTTFSAIATVNKYGDAEILTNVEGDRITPSVILFEGNDVIVGNYAKQAAVVYPEQVVEFVKRHMGEADYRFDYRGRSYNPEELSSFILQKLKHDAELRLGHPVEHAVITVPAYFNDHERRATIRAGEKAGFNVLKLLNEPTAAAFAYGLSNQGQDQRVLVYDLGGGTFDVTMVDIAGKEINVIATAGDHHLGGKDYDDVLIEHVAAAFRDKHGVDPLSDLQSYHDLRQKCVSAKISLTRRPKVNIFHDFDGKVLRLAVTRELFEGLAAAMKDLDLDEKTLGKDALKQKKEVIDTTQRKAKQGDKEYVHNYGPVDRVKKRQRDADYYEDVPEDKKEQHPYDWGKTQARELRLVLPKRPIGMEPSRFVRGYCSLERRPEPKDAISAAHDALASYGRAMARERHHVAQERGDDTSSWRRMKSGGHIDQDWVSKLITRNRALKSSLTAIIQREAPDRSIDLETLIAAFYGATNTPGMIQCP